MSLFCLKIDLDVLFFSDEKKWMELLVSLMFYCLHFKIIFTITAS